MRQDRTQRSSTPAITIKFTEFEYINQIWRPKRCSVLSIIKLFQMNVFVLPDCTNPFAYYALKSHILKFSAHNSHYVFTYYDFEPNWAFRIMDYPKRLWMPSFFSSFNTCVIRSRPVVWWKCMLTNIKLLGWFAFLQSVHRARQANAHRHT